MKRTVAVLILSLLAAGCASSTIPPRLTRAERDLIQTTKIHAVVGVQPYKHIGYSNRLVAALRQTGMFDEVALLEDLQREPDLIATVEQSVYGTATIPIFTILTLGVIPTTVKETHGYVFSLRPGPEAPPLVLDTRYTGPTTLGWAAMFLNLSTRRTVKDPYKTDRLNDALTAEIAKRAGEIRALIPESGSAGAASARSR